MLRLALTALAALIAAPAIAQDRVPVESLSSVPVEERTEVMILATSHFAGVEGVTASHFDAVIARLKAFDPHIVAVERIPAHEIAMFRTTPHYAETLDTYVGDHLSLMTDGQAGSGLDPVEAEAAMGDWTGAPSTLDEDAQVERLMTALAAYELETALVYFRALGGPDREDWPRAVPANVVEALTELDASMNERVAVAARLVGELDLPRVWNVDSHLEDAAFRPIVPELMAGFEQVGGQAALAAAEPFGTLDGIQTRAVEAGSVLPVYDFMNTPGYGIADIRAQIDVMNRIDFPAGEGKARQALWDERNYRIAANVRRAMAAQPGKRVLLVIGAGHKPWLDQILTATLDMRIVQWADIGDE